MNATPVIHINTPFQEAVARSLNAGDAVRISGTLIAARDAAHKRMVEALLSGEALPVDLRDQIIYYVGPTPAKPGNPIGAAGPTTAGRMDVYTPPLLEIGLRGMIGKGRRSPEAITAMQKHGAVFFAALGGAGALLASCIKRYEILAYADLGTEALARLEVVDFPAIVAIDTLGNDIYAR
jgi:fumarate hydratase subunit beta